MATTNRQTITRPATTDDDPANRDPISGAPGSHPVGVGVGAAGGGVTGAALGALGGPIGAAVGAGVGAVVGGLAGKGVAEAIDPTVEDAFWRDAYVNRPYVRAGAEYRDYQPAYQYGWESAKLYQCSFEDAEEELERGWTNHCGSSTLSWENAKAAVHDAWERVKTGVVL